MAWNERKALSVIGALAALIVMTTTLAASPASAVEPCDLILRATASAGSTSGSLDVTATPAVGDLWTYSVTALGGYSLEWLDGTFAVTPGEAASQIAGGMMTREPSLTGEFIQLSACFRLDASPIARSAVGNVFGVPWEIRPGVALL